MPANNNLSPISCETCRQRKCKCDRKLPCCSQCSNEPSRCVYPESGKRGLPLGYLNQLEQRLAETESALESFSPRTFPKSLQSSFALSMAMP
ncbi:transcriptional regulator family: Fungal Specific TF [Penicillium roqueforti]|uniref:transcriptional regulator family: Fungal Specific TF n=1 Tax=Penicillium roqueforti TaxID=5082 RepID=UPI00190AC8F8|nr:transcriptional regulator family: Fungal Specific TF [Penicillium roqueforti]KAF9249633.1 transcriptional regulator family: Fungal Specific TF [Penicillium roqueforti]KAI1835175.1 transcriptional regulator family: Fungal Specific TF [Penicillium roqueforti]KAI2677188.1 transcriptional regulator family: Fungal Specific TF [Penicillium roqueforti]KAI2688515.1 transcriptional regulator family: Fungal Specific TF [Penicillium roqueforti]KAI2700690.1 transcriptional regulator family: Fungal Spec